MSCMEERENLIRAAHSSLLASCGLLQNIFYVLGLGFRIHCLSPDFKAELGYGPLYKCLGPNYRSSHKMTPRLALALIN